MRDRVTIFVHEIHALSIDQVANVIHRFRNEHGNESFIFFFSPFQKNSVFFLCDSEDFVKIQGVASSSPSLDSRLRKGGEGEPDFTEA